MAIGDGDLSVFFADFGVRVVFAGSTVMGNLDEPLDAFAGAGGPSRMESQRFAVTLPYNAFTPAPVAGNTIVVGGISYGVQGRSRSEDGKLLTLELKK